MAEHKRRARWRLLGALIITGAVAAVAPVLLEEQARPLSQDLLIEIPSKTSAFGKIETLKPAAPSDDSNAEGKPAEAKPTEAKPAEVKPAEVKPAEAKAAELKADGKAAVKAEPKPAAKSDIKPETKVDAKDTKADTKAEPKPAVKTDPKAVAKDTKTEPKAEVKTEVKVPSGAATAGVFVQVGAYASIDAANVVKAKLTSGGHKVTIETIKAEDGTERHRVRIGPFETRDQALQVRDRAKTQGYDAMVVNP